MEAERYSEMSVYFYQTIRRRIPRDSILYSYRRQKLKTHIHLVYLNYQIQREPEVPVLLCKHGLTLCWKLASRTQKNTLGGMRDLCHMPVGVPYITCYNLSTVPFT